MYGRRVNVWAEGACMGGGCRAKAWSRIRLESLGFRGFRVQVSGFGCRVSVVELG